MQSEIQATDSRMQFKGQLVRGSSTKSENHHWSWALGRSSRYYATQALKIRFSMHARMSVFQSAKEIYTLWRCASTLSPHLRCNEIWCAAFHLNQDTKPHALSLNRRQSGSEIPKLQTYTAHRRLSLIIESADCALYLLEWDGCMCRPLIVLVALCGLGPGFLVVQWRLDCTIALPLLGWVEILLFISFRKQVS